MQKKKLTAEVARELAASAEEGFLLSLSIRRRLSGKNKGQLWADYETTETVTFDTSENSRIKLTETLEEVANQIASDNDFELIVNKDSSSQFISYTRGAH